MLCPTCSAIDTGVIEVIDYNYNYTQKSWTNFDFLDRVHRYIERILLSRKYFFCFQKNEKNSRLGRRTEVEKEEEESEGKDNIGEKATERKEK